MRQETLQGWSYGTTWFYSFLMQVAQCRYVNPGMTQLVKRAPPLIPQKVRGFIDAERSQDSL
jgi:hypothetical protein